MLLSLLLMTGWWDGGGQRSPSCGPTPKPLLPPPGPRPFLHPFTFPTEAPGVGVDLPDLRTRQRWDLDEGGGSAWTFICYTYIHCPSLETQLSFLFSDL